MKPDVISTNNCIADHRSGKDDSRLESSRRRFMAMSLATALCMPKRSVAAVPEQNDIIGELQYHVTDSSSTLLELAEFHDLGLLELSAVNRGVDVWVPGSDRLIVLPKAHVLPETERHGIVINLAELRLYQFDDDGSVHSHAIGIGRQGFGTPYGKTRIVRKKADPTWYPTAETRADKPELPASVGPGPDNPLGRHAIYLGWPTYLIHGTNKPFGVGRRVSRGCIRMYPQRVAELFERVGDGQPVEVIHEPIKLGWQQGELFIEAHPDTDQLDELEATYSITVKPAPDIRQRVLDKAGPRAADIDWALLRTELIERRGIPLQITRDRRQSRASNLVSSLPSSLPGIY